MPHDIITDWKYPQIASLPRAQILRVNLTLCTFPHYTCLLSLDSIYVNFEVVEKLITGSFYLYFSSKGTASRAKNKQKKPEEAEKHWRWKWKDSVRQRKSIYKWETVSEDELSFMGRKGETKGESKEKTGWCKVTDMKEKRCACFL